jgi:hypothetical protein
MEAANKEAIFEAYTIETNTRAKLLIDEKTREYSLRINQLEDRDSDSILVPIYNHEEMEKYGFNFYFYENQLAIGRWINFKIMHYFDNRNRSVSMAIEIPKKFQVEIKALLLTKVSSGKINSFILLDNKQQRVSTFHSDSSSCLGKYTEEALKVNPFDFQALDLVYKTGIEILSTVNINDMLQPDSNEHGLEFYDYAHNNILNSNNPDDEEESDMDTDIEELEDAEQTEGQT